MITTSKMRSNAIGHIHQRIKMPGDTRRAAIRIPTDAEVRIKAQITGIRSMLASTTARSIAQTETNPAVTPSSLGCCFLVLVIGTISAPKGR